MRLLAVLPFLLFFLYQDFKLRKWGKATKEASTLHHDMWDKLQELLDDPTMTYLKWKAWLPVFEAADERSRMLDPETAARLGSLAEKVRRIIREDDYKQDVEM